LLQTHPLIRIADFSCIVDSFALQKTDTGYVLPIPKYNPTSMQSFTWTRDIGLAAAALLRNYSDPSKGVLGKAFPVVTGIMTYLELARKMSAGK
jgi:hypothetical protein